MTILRVENICKSFNNVKILESINFEVNKGEIIGLLGPNGAGKSTLIKIIAGIIKPDKGKIEFNGKDIFKSYKEIKNEIGIVFQENTLDEELSVFDNLYIVGLLRNIKNVKQKILKKAKLLDIEKFLKIKVGNLSGGVKRRVELCKALLHDPKLIILDEPTVGLDIKAKENFWNYLKLINKKEKVSILFSSHDPIEIEYLCNKVVFINNKQLGFWSKKELIEMFGKYVIFGSLTKHKKTIFEKLDQLNIKYVIKRNKVLIFVKDKSFCKEVFKDLSPIKLIKFASNNLYYIFKYFMWKGYESNTLQRDLKTSIFTNKNIWNFNISDINIFITFRNRN